jgi:hypothetical protein
LWFNMCIHVNAENRSAVVNLIANVKQECLGEFNKVEEEPQASKQFSSLKEELTETTSKVGAGVSESEP